MRDFIASSVGFTLRRYLFRALGAVILLIVYYCVGMHEPPRWGLLVFGIVVALGAYWVGLLLIRKIDDRDTF